MPQFDWSRCWGCCFLGNIGRPYIVLVSLPFETIPFVSLPFLRQKPKHANNCARIQANDSLSQQFRFTTTYECTGCSMYLSKFTKFVQIRFVQNTKIHGVLQTTLDWFGDAIAILQVSARYVLSALRPQRNKSSRGAPPPFGALCPHFWRITSPRRSCGNYRTKCMKCRWL